MAERVLVQCDGCNRHCAAELDSSRARLPKGWSHGMGGWPTRSVIACSEECRYTIERQTCGSTLAQESANAR